MSRTRPGASLIFFVVVLVGVFVVLVAALVVLVGGAGAFGAEATDTVAGPEVVLVEHGALPYGTSVAVVDELPPRTVLRVTAAGFEPEAAGVIEQCAGRGCANPFPVSFDLNGRARFQYLVTDAFTASSTCRADAPPCVVRLRTDDARDAALVTTVFHDAAPAPRRVTVTPSEGGVVDGAPVLVTVSGFTPGERVQAMLCAAPDTFGPRRCGAPGPATPFRIDTDGTGRTALVIHQTRVGTDRAPCGRDSKCGVVVVSEKSSVPGAVFPITFAAGPGAQYDTARLLLGLGIAAALLGLAFFLVRTTDWRKPTEADTPDLDAAIRGLERALHASDRTEQDAGMTDERMQVERTIAAEPAAIFRVLADPQGHVSIDSSGMLMDATGEPVTAVGDRFVVHMDREALNDFPMGLYDVTVVITKFIPDQEIAWTIEGVMVPPIGHVYGYTLAPTDGGTLVTSYYDWSSINEAYRGAGIFPIIPESALRATLGILARTVARNARA